jgi:hypothetical protein
MFETDDGNLREADELGGFVAAVAGDNLIVLIDQNWRIEAERFDAPSDCPNLRPTMPTRIAWVGIQVGDAVDRILLARRRDRRCTAGAGDAIGAWGDRDVARDDAVNDIEWLRIAKNRRRAADANAILSIGERLSYRQICVLAAFDGKGEFVKVMRVNNVDGLIDKLWDGGAQVLAHDVQQVFETHGLIGLSDHIGPNSPPEQIHVGLTSLGQIAFSLMGLGDVPPADGAEVVARFKVALGLT